MSYEQLRRLLNTDQSTKRIAELAGVSRRTVARWRNNGVIPNIKADHIAIALGRHPAEIWHEWTQI